MKIVSVEAQNSLAFVETAFALYEADEPFVISRPETRLEDYGQLEIIRNVATAGPKGWARLKHHPKTSDHPAQLTFTSGTEGRPKPIVLSHRNLADVVMRLNDVMQVTDEIREYIGVPVTYSFGLGRVRAVSAAGGAFYLPERFDPSEIRTMLEAGEINAISAVPSLWRIVLATPEVIGSAGEKVRWIEIGSQYMSGEEKADMKRLFPNARIVQHYGLTEASRSTFLVISEEEGEILESVGYPIGPVEVEVAPDEAIRIRGNHVALGILGSDGHIEPLIDQAGWLVTKDRGAISANGAVQYLGRLDDQINIAGIKLAAETLEQEINSLVSMPGMFAVASIPDPLRGDGILLALKDTAGDRTGLIETAAQIALRRNGMAQQGVVRTIQVGELPLTESGKVQRRKLRDIYLAGQPSTPEPDHPIVMTELTATEVRIAEVWQKTLGPVPLRPDQSFYDIGGDSLCAVQVGLGMEAQGFSRIAVRATLEGKELCEIAQLTDATDDAVSSPIPSGDLTKRTSEAWSINAVRGIMVLSVLISHWGPGVFARLGLEAEADAMISVIYRMGTPGFAVVFGLGLGYYFLPVFDEKRKFVTKRLASYLFLVAIGLILFAVVHFVKLYASGNTINGQSVAFAFYNILAYYALALATASLWLRILSISKRPFVAALVIAGLMWILWLISSSLVRGPNMDSLAEWLRLMFGAGNYTYFKVSASAFLGIALGLWFSRQEDLAETAGILVRTSSLCIAGIVIISLEIWGVQAFIGRGGAIFQSFLAPLFYASFAALLLGVFVFVMLRWRTLGQTARIPLQFLVVIGGLALPIFVFHGVVIPIKDILLLVGVPGPIALALPMSTFLLGLGLAFRKLYRMYFT